MGLFDWLKPKTQMPGPTAEGLYGALPRGAQWVGGARPCRRSRGFCPGVWRVCVPYQRMEMGQATLDRSREPIRRRPGGVRPRSRIIRRHEHGCGRALGAGKPRPGFEGTPGMDHSTRPSDTGAGAGLTWRSNDPPAPNARAVLRLSGDVSSSPARQDRRDLRAADGAGNCRSGRRPLHGTNEGCVPGAEWLALRRVLPEREFPPQADLGIGKIQ